MNPETAEVVYQDEERIIYKDVSLHHPKLFEGKMVEGEIVLREIDGYSVTFMADGTTLWAGATIKSSPIHANFSEFVA